MQERDVEEEMKLLSSCSVSEICIATARRLRRTVLDFNRYQRNGETKKEENSAKRIGNPTNLDV